MVRRTSRDIEKFVTFQNEVNKNYEGERRAERRWKNLNAKQGKKMFLQEWALHGGHVTVGTDDE